MNGAIPPRPQYAFMAWCSVNFTFISVTLHRGGHCGLTEHAQNKGTATLSERLVVWALEHKDQRG